jgi:hypothetical protein
MQLGQPSLSFQRADISSTKDMEGYVQDCMALDRTCKSYCFPVECHRCFGQEELRAAGYYTVCDKDGFHSCYFQSNFLL